MILVVAFLATTVGAVGFGGFVGAVTLATLSEGLPEPNLDDLSFEQPTIVYDRTGKVELARFFDVNRKVVQFDDIPLLVLDATTTAEDRTFWENDGYDLAAIVSAVASNSFGEAERGASTITQQLVRARLLPPELLAPGADRYLRKAKELIQAARVTEAYPGEAGKRDIMTAYLNQIFYGHDAYGIAAAARRYFGVSNLADLTPAQAALLAGLPKSPTTYDPYLYATRDEEGRLVVNPDSPAVERRNWILTNLNASARWTHLPTAALERALAEPVVLSGTEPLTYQAPHAMWQVRDQLVGILGSLDAVNSGGYRVRSTIDLRLQGLAEKWITAATVAPNLKKSSYEELLDRLKIPKGDRAWISKLRGADLHNGALVALDYRTGDVLAYVGSAGYYRDTMASKKFEPKFDVAGDGPRQPGSAWKPVVYGSAFDDRVLTPGSLLLDVTTEFGRGWAPHDADNRERGPVLVRDALQNSLNTPAIRALERVGSESVVSHAAAMGIGFQGGPDAFRQAGLAGAIGTVEVTPLDLTGAYGTIANGGVHVPSRLILEVTDTGGRVVWTPQEPALAGLAALSPEAAYLVSDILAGNTDPRQNKFWASILEIDNGKNGRRRPAAVKTGTTNDARDLSTYGFLAPPKDADAPALVAGVWLGNSDHSLPKSKNPATSLNGPAPLWQAFMREASAKWPIADFARPKGVVTATIDSWTGGRPGGWTRATRKELFIDGTQPGAKHAVDKAGLLYSVSCGVWKVDPVKAELGPKSWRDDVADWARRARGGAGRFGAEKTATAYLPGRTGWGGAIAGPCAPRKTPPPATPGPTDDGGGNGGGNGNGGGGNGGGGNGGGGGGNGGGGGGNGGGGGGGGNGGNPTPTPPPGTTEPATTGTTGATATSR